MALKTEALHCSRSLARNIKQRSYCITVDYAFNSVVRRCAYTPRPDQYGTWLTHEMQQAYIQLYRLGHAHSFEYWYLDGCGTWCLGGGLYGVMIGLIFFGESMFAHVNDASKITFVHAVHFLRNLGVPLIDCQVHTEHLARFGAQHMDFSQFRQYLQSYCPQKPAEMIRPHVLCHNHPSADFTIQPQL